MKLRRVLVWVNTALGTALTLAPFVLFPVCVESKPDGTPMSCWYSGVFIMAMGIAVLAFSLMSFWGRFSALFTILSAAAALMAWLVPNRLITLAGEGWVCGLCAAPSHACRAVMLPALGVLVAASVLVNAAVLILNFIQGRR